MTVAPTTATGVVQAGPERDPQPRPTDGPSRRFCGADPGTGLHTTWVVTPVLGADGQVSGYRVEWSPGIVEREQWLYATKVTTLLSVGEGAALVARISAL